MSDDSNCLTCGYSLRGLADPRCPECGRAFDLADPNTFLSARSLKPGGINRGIRPYVVWLLLMLLLAGWLGSGGLDFVPCFAYLASGPFGWVHFATNFNPVLMILVLGGLYGIWGLVLFRSAAGRWGGAVHGLLAFLWYVIGAILSLVIANEYFGVRLGC